MISILNIKKYLIFLCALWLIFGFQTVNAQTTNKNLVNIYFFHSNDCSHCKGEAKILNTIEQKYDNVKIYRYEIHQDNNNEIRKNVQELYAIKANGVPLTIIGDTPYSGYLEEKSDLQFIKTIEYYSKYGYQDRVGELLQIDKLPNYNIDNNAPTLEEFMDTYGNYKIIGNLYTDDLDLLTTTTILGLLSQLNIIRLISILIVLWLLSKIKSEKYKLLLLALYYGSYFLNYTNYIFSNEIYTIITAIIILILFILGLLSYRKIKNQSIYINIFLIIAIIGGCIENSLYSSPLDIFKELISLHNIVGLEVITYYINYFLIIVLTNLIIFLILYSLKKIISQKFIFYIK
ncbi:MAG: hypothetical protein IJ509_01920 [Bacilli bacterium]|nr:hypothetical protein [Bacilli bacterium]